MTEQASIYDHENVELLLPWYVNRTLSEAEQDHVRQHVETCAECQRNAAFLSTVQDAVCKGTPTPIVPQPRVADLQGSIDLAENESSRRHWHVGFAVAVSALAAIVIVALVIDYRYGAADLPTQFETATSDSSSSAMSYVMSIQFEAGTETADHDRIMELISAEDVSQADADGAYTVVVQIAAASLEQLERFTSKVRSMPEVKSIDVVAVQLPMRQNE